MKVSYTRAPKSDFGRLFQPGGLLSPLRDSLSSKAGDADVGLDLQFRPNREAHLYCLGNAILKAKFHPQKNLVEVFAHPTYQGQGCFLTRQWSPSDSNHIFAAQLETYLRAVAITPHEEGAVQARWIGNQHSSEGRLFPWVSIDREVRLEYGSTEDREESVLTKEIELAYQAIGSLASSTPGWSSPGEPPNANKVDQLAISKDGRELVLVELKWREGPEVLYSPLQLARYINEWVLALSGPYKAPIVNGINELVHAKNMLGLIPGAPLLIESPLIRPIIGFNDPPSAEMLSQLPKVWEAIARFVDDRLVLRPEVWTWPDRGQPRKVQSL